MWLALAATLLLAPALVAWSERLPPAAPATAPVTEFSARRAWPALAYLADTVGARVAGSAGAEDALQYLATRLRALPGWEVEVQDVTGVRMVAQRATAYRTRNVLARLPGRTPAAVLLSSHYDTPTGSVGAADDAVAAAAMVEVARALSADHAAGTIARNTVILNINGAEEQGLLGAEGFLHHRWARDVRAFVDLESAGTGGKAILFQVGPGHAWLARAYAASAPHPYGSVIGQDIFQSGFIPSSTDFEVYRDRGYVPGLDIAFYRDGWKYHTALDRTAAVAPGSVQHMGDNALALARELAAGELPDGEHPARSVYYDLLGLHMIAYAQPAARLAAVGVALFALLAMAVAARRTPVSWRDAGVATVATLAGVVLAVVFAVGGAALASMVAQRPHGWFAHPWRGALAYALLALAGLLAGQWLFARRHHARMLPLSHRLSASWMAAIVVQLLALGALTVYGIGAGYVVAWSVAGGALGLLLAGHGDGRRPVAALLLGWLPGTVLATQVTWLLVTLFAPIAGRFPLPVPFDLPLAAMVAVGTIAGALGPVAAVQAAGRTALAALAALAAGLAMLAVTAATFPYTPERPQRLTIVHEDAYGPTLRITALDVLGPERALRAAGGGAADSAERVQPDARSVLRDAPPLSYPAVEPVVVAERALGGGGRELELRLPSTGASSLRLELPDDARITRIAGQPLARPAAPPLRLVGAPDGGWLITVHLPETRPVPVRVRAHYDHATPAARELMAALPAWTSPIAWVEDWVAVVR